MFDKLSEKNIWVSVNAENNGDGSFENPYSGIKTAIDNAVAGSVIVLLSGIYNEKLIVRDVCGTIENPITITSFSQNGEDVISNSEWYFYSVSDFVIKDIKFKNTENSAISMVGESQRNSIKNCEFLQCGEVAECSVFFGGSGGDCNVVENCEFTAPQNTENHIAVMISQSIDNEDGTILNSTNTTIRFCRFKNCKTAIVAGSDENISELFGDHEISDCLFDNCENGVKIKISGTVIFGNIFRNCQNGIINTFGAENEIFENRFENCEKAISIFCDDLTIKENCFVNSAISLEANNKNEENSEETLPVLICENTFVGAEIAAAQKGDTTSFITKNIFYDCKISDTKNIVEKDNKTVETGEFTDFANGDFSTNTNYGCSSGAEKRLEIEEIPLVDIVEMFELQKNSEHRSDKNLSQKTMEERDLFLKSMYFQDESEEEEIEVDSMSVGQQILRPIGIDGELEDN